MNQDQTARATLEMVAKLAGVSKATASKVLNRRPSVAPQTRQRVEDAIESLGYVPSTGPRESADLLQVNVVFDSLINIYSMEVLNGIVSAAQEHGVEVVLEIIDFTPSKHTPLEGPWVRNLATLGRTGVIVVTTELTSHQLRSIRDAGLSLVAIDPFKSLDDDVVSIGSTNFTGGMQATRHLLELGHERIAYAGGPEHSVPSQERLHGYRGALEDAGIPVRSDYFLQEKFTYDAGLHMSLQFLALPEPPTAIFAGSDVTALGILEGARRLGLKVPEELSVVGFDDTYAALFTAPPMTTVSQPMHDMGRVALRTLLQQSRGERLDSHHVQLSTQLVIRSSTAPPATHR